MDRTVNMLGVRISCLVPQLLSVVVIAYTYGFSLIIRNLLVVTYIRIS